MTRLAPVSDEWIPPDFVWTQVVSHLLNVGLPHLELIVALIAPPKAAGEEPPPIFGVAG